MRKRKKDNIKDLPQEGMVGRLVDMSLEDFEKELVRQKVNIGIINNLILTLEGVYFELRVRKDAVLSLMFKEEGSQNPEVKKSLDGLYAEMIKVEQKIVYLKQRSKELAVVD